MHSFWSKLSGWLENKKAMTGLLLFLVCFSYFAWLEWQPSFPDPDSFYHIKVSQMMGSDNLIIKSFPWLSQTTLSKDYVDQHFLYHLLMVPFVKYLPSFTGAKLFQAILASLMILVFYWLLRKMGIKYAFWWSFSLLLSEAFVFRLALVKAQPLALIIFFTSIFLIIKKKYWLLFFLAPIYVWSYGGWFFLLVLSAVYILTDLWDQKNDFPLWKKFRQFFKLENLKLLSAVIGGLIVGLIANPYFPKNLFFYYEQIVQIGLFNLQKNVIVGSEWHPMDPLIFLRTNFFCLLLITAATILFWDYRNRVSKQEKYFFILFCLFVLGTAKAQRNIEYLIPMTTLFAAAVFHQANLIPKMKADLAIVADKLKNFFFWSNWIKRLSITVFILVSILVLINMTTSTKKFLEGSPTFQKSSEFMAKTIPPKEIVFNASWSYFPMYFYYDDKNYYLIGMDPTFMSLKNPVKYQEWYAISSGKDKIDLAKKIKSGFESQYIICSKVQDENKDMINNLDHSEDFTKLYEDPEAIIYKIK